jgi:hypothetical protein
MKANEYRLVSHPSAMELNLEVSKLFEEGWDLYGDPIVSFVSSAGADGHAQLYYAYSQALIKTHSRSKPGF